VKRRFHAKAQKKNLRRKGWNHAVACVLSRVYEIRIPQYPVFTVRGDDLEVELGVAACEAVLGARIEVPTIEGQAEMTVPAGAQSGQLMRLRGQGLNKRKGGRGNEYVRLKIVVPRETSDEERRLYEELKRVSSSNPRAGKQATKGGVFYFINRTLSTLI
jgi:DnaJ-class molecular chaperone